MAKKKMSKKIIAAIVVLVLGTAIYTANALNMIDLSPLLDIMPWNAESVEPAITDNTEIPPESPLVKENQELHGLLKTLEEEKMALEIDKITLTSEGEKMSLELKDLKEKLTELEAQETNVKKLAQYYQDMKPDAAVKILNNLEDRLVLQILLKIPHEQAGKILAVMDPQRAAMITQLLLGNQ